MAMNVVQLRADLTADLQAIFEDLDKDKTAAQKALEIATVIADRLDAYIRTATVTTTTQSLVGPLSAGLQTSTAPGNPTGPPAVPQYIDGDGIGSLS